MSKDSDKIVCSTPTLRGQLFPHCSLRRSRVRFNVTGQWQLFAQLLLWEVGCFFIVLFGGPKLDSTSPNSETIVCSIATLGGQLFLHCSLWRSRVRFNVTGQRQLRAQLLPYEIGCFFIVLFGGAGIFAIPDRWQNCLLNFKLGSRVCPGVKITGQQKNCLLNRYLGSSAFLHCMFSLEVLGFLASQGLFIWKPSSSLVFSLEVQGWS